MSSLGRWPTAFLLTLLLVPHPTGTCAGLEPQPAAPEPAPSEPAARITGSLSLADAAQLALSYNRNLQVVLRQRGIAAGRITEAWGEALPTASLSSSYTRLDEVTSFEIEGRTITFGALDNYSAGLSVEQPVFRGGALRAGLRAASIYRALTDEQIRNALQETLYATVAAYYRARLARQEQEVAASYVRQAEAHLADVRTRRRHGVASDFNVLRAEVDLANAQTELTRLANGAEQAHVLLLETMGVSLDSAVELVDEPEYRPLAIDERRAAERALAQRPDIAGAQLNVDLQEQAVAAARSRYWPEVDAFFNYRYARPDPRVSTLDAWGDTWQAGLTLRYPLFDRGREGRLAREQALLEQRHVELDAAREVARVDVRTAHLTLINAERAVETQSLNLERAREGLRLAEVSFREGTIDQVAVLDATTALTQARLLYFRSVYAHAMARLDLSRATGLLVPRQVRDPGDVDVDRALRPPDELADPE